MSNDEGNLGDWFRKSLDDWQAFIEDIKRNPHLEIHATIDPPASESEIARAEAAYESRFPEAYRAFLALTGRVLIEAVAKLDDNPLRTRTEFFSPAGMLNGAKDAQVSGFLPVYRKLHDLIEAGEYIDDTLYGFNIPTSDDGMWFVNDADSLTRVKSHDFKQFFSAAFENFKDGIGELEYEITDTIGYVRGAKNWLKLLLEGFGIVTINGSLVAEARKLAPDAVEEIRLILQEDRIPDFTVLRGLENIKSLRLDIQHDYKSKNPSAFLERIEGSPRQGIRRLQIDCMSETDFAFLDHFPDLEELELGFSRVHSLADFSNLKHLHKLTMGRGTVVFQGDPIVHQEPDEIKLPPHLVELHMAGMELTKLPRFTGGESLRMIYIDGCDFGRLDLSPLRSLNVRELLIRDSKVTTLDFEREFIEQLDSLDLHYNSLPDSEKERLREILPGEGRLYLD